MEKTFKTRKDGWESPLGEGEESVKMAKMFEDSKCKPSTPLLGRGHKIILRTTVERVLQVHEGPPNFGPDETVELLTKTLGASDEDPDLTTLLATLKSKLELAYLKNPVATLSLGVELLITDVKRCRRIQSTLHDSARLCLETTSAVLRRHGGYSPHRPLQTT